MLTLFTDFSETPCTWGEPEATNTNFSGNAEAPSVPGLRLSEKWGPLSPFRV